MKKEQITLIFIALLWVTMWAVVIITGVDSRLTIATIPFAGWYGWTFAKYFTN